MLRVLAEFGLPSLVLAEADLDPSATTQGWIMTGLPRKRRFRHGPALA